VDLNDFETVYSREEVVALAPAAFAHQVIPPGLTACTTNVHAGDPPRTRQGLTTRERALSRHYDRRLHVAPIGARADTTRESALAVGSTAEEYAARQLGQPIGAGIAAGIEASTASIQDALRGAMRNAIDVDVPGRTVLRPAPALAGGVGPRGAINVTVNVDKLLATNRVAAREIARLVEPEIRNLVKYEIPGVAL
jgi:hypothetical protein